mgnify:CR=1 FL=1
MSKKIEQKELDQLKNQEATKARLLAEIGAVEAKKHEFLHAFAELVSQSIEANNKLEEKYGKINVDLKDGSYEEVKEENAEEDGQAN